MALVWTVVLVGIGSVLRLLCGFFGRCDFWLPGESEVSVCELSVSGQDRFCGISFLLVVGYLGERTC
jgi:hypothetical protein